MQITSSQVEVTSNLEFGEVVEMGFDKAAASFLLNNLIKQYSNPYVAAMREYLSNALDSHRLAGQTRPVELTVPSPLFPNLVIEDFGVGLTREELKGYGQFGSSTKRDTNDQIGGFGLGSKSGLAVASQIVVTAVKDGLKNTVVVGRREDGHPTMGFLNAEPEPTDEPNGVRVTIPTSEVHKFQSAIDREFFIGWPQGSILVNGEEPKTIRVHDEKYFQKMEDAGWRAKRGMLTDTGTDIRGRAYALVDSVLYSIDLRQVEGLDHRLITGFLSEIVIKLDNGSVEIHPSRETLIYDARTRAEIKRRVDILVGMGKKQYQEEVDKASTIREALQVRSKSISFGFGDQYTYRGKKIDLNLGLDADHPLREALFTQASIAHGNRVAPWMANRSTSMYWQMTDWHFERLFREGNTKPVLVVGAADPTLVRGRKLHVEANGAVHWAVATAEAEGLSSPTVFDIWFTSVPVKQLNPWFVGAFERVIKAEDFMKLVIEERKAQAKIKREIVRATKVKPEDSEVRVMDYQEYGRSSYNNVKISDLDKTKKHVLLKNGADEFTDKVRAVFMTQVGYSNYRWLHDILHYVVKNADVVFVLANKNTNTTDYAKHIPNLSTDVKALIENVAKKLVAAKTEIEKRATLDRAMDRSPYDWATSIREKHHALIADADTRAWIKAMSSTKTAGDAFLSNIVQHGSKYGLDPKTAEITSSLAVSPGERYKLLNVMHWYGSNAEVLVEYINEKDELEAARAAAQEESETPAED